MPLGYPGEILVGGGGVSPGYVNRPTLSAERFIPDPVDAARREAGGRTYRTGDLGRVDEGGYLFLVDRVKDMIITGGENVFSSEVESVLSLHPAVSDVVIIGIPHEQWGEQVHAVVIKSNDHSGDSDELVNELQAFCKEKIAGYKCPKSIEFTDQPFPLSAAGKVLKADIRKPYWAGHNRMVN